MELSFVLNAVKRYWWAVVAFMVFGTFIGVQLRGDAQSNYRSTALLYMAAPTNLITDVFRSGQDRYLLGQLSVLTSDELANRVADAVGDIDPDLVPQLMTITQVMATDVVSIQADATTPEVAEALAGAYVTEYMELLQEQIDEVQEPSLRQMRSSVAELRRKIDEVDASIAEVMAPFIASESESIPALDQIAPELSTSRQILLQQYERVSNSLDQMQLNNTVKVASKVVQRASEAKLETSSGGTKKLAAGVLTGIMAGVVVAAFLASQSKKALDEQQVGEVLGAEVVGLMPTVRSYARNRRGLLESTPARLGSFVDRLNVQAEASARIGEAFTVVVVGTERASGTTTLACAMAHRYAAGGSRVLLIDADPRDSEITRLFAPAAPGIPALLAGVPTGEAGPRRGPTLRLDPFSSTGQPGLSVVGIGDKASVTALRRQNVPDLIEAAARNAHVVVIDGGPLMDAASTVQLATLVDAVVLVVPMRKLRTRALSTIVAQLGDRRGDLLPVLVPVSRRRRSPGARRNDGGGAPRSFGLADTPAVEQIVLPPEPASLGRR